MELREAQFKTREVELNFVEGPPNGPPFVVLHGGAVRWQHGQALLEALASRWHVYAPDFRGHGKSGRVPGAYRLQDYVQDTAEFLDGVLDGPAVLYGHSMGGEVAVTLAAQRAELVRALIVGDAPLSTTNHADERPQTRAQNLLWQRLSGQPANLIVDALKDMLVARPGESRPRPAREVMGENSPWFAFQATSLHQLDPDMLTAVLTGPQAMLNGYDPGTLLPAITCPVLLLQADSRQGAALCDEDVVLGLRLLPRATHVRLDGIGHTLHAIPDQIPQILQAVSPFLDHL
jgi:pimeloyl-ACP methyl ester carboxylesterase